MLEIKWIWTTGTGISQSCTAYLQYLLDVASSKRAEEYFFKCMFVWQHAAKSTSYTENNLNPHSCPYTPEQITNSILKVIYKAEFINYLQA